MCGLDLSDSGKDCSGGLFRVKLLIFVLCLGIYGLPVQLSACYEILFLGITECKFVYLSAHMLKYFRIGDVSGCSETVNSSQNLQRNKDWVVFVPFVA